MCTTCEDFAAGLIDSVTADVCSDAERGVLGPAGEFVEDDEDLAPPCSLGSRARASRDRASLP